MKKVLIVLSGGQDSTTCGFWAKEQGYELHAVTFDYGQRHMVEIEAAKIVGKLLNVKSHEVVELSSNILVGSSPLVNPAETLEQYANHQSLPGGLEKTFVPMRNQLFLTVAANRAYALGCDMLITGVCEEDFGGYPDCRQLFINALAYASSLGTFTEEAGWSNGLSIMTPLMSMSKADSVKLALELPGCYEALQHTHTSYDGAYPPTGHDHATLLRAKGFEQANVPDPLVLRAWYDGLMELPDSSNYKDEILHTALVRLEMLP